MPTQPRFGHNQSINAHNRFQGRFEQQNSVPTIMYLMTSMDPDYDPYWTHDPVAVPKGVSHPTLRHGWTYQIGWCVVALATIEFYRTSYFW